MANYTPDEQALDTGSRSVGNFISRQIDNGVGIAKNLASGIATTASSLWHGVADKDGKLNGGSILGGALFGVGGWILGNAFGGEGWLSCLSYALAGLGMVLGTKFGDEHFASMFGDHNRQVASNEPVRQQQYGQVIQSQQTLAQNTETQHMYDQGIPQIQQQASAAAATRFPVADAGINGGTLPPGASGMASLTPAQRSAERV